MTTTSYIANQNALPLGKADIAWFFENYLASPADAKDPADRHQWGRGLFGYLDTAGASSTKRMVAYRRSPEY